MSNSAILQHVIQCKCDAKVICLQYLSVRDANFRFCDGQTKKTKKKTEKKQTRPRSSAGSRPTLPKFSGYVEVAAHYIFHPSTIWVRPLFTELGPKNPPFAIKQTNICRLSGDINMCQVLYPQHIGLRMLLFMHATGQWMRQ